MRFEGDEIIYEAWGEIEKAFSNFSGDARLKNCAKYGVIYYDRPDRKRNKENND